MPEENSDSVTDVFILVCGPPRSGKSRVVAAIKAMLNARADFKPSADSVVEAPPNAMPDPQDEPRLLWLADYGVTVKSRVENSRVVISVSWPVEQGGRRRVACIERTSSTYLRAVRKALDAAMHECRAMRDIS